MTQRDEVYQCELCGNLVSVVHGAGGTLVCCGQDMVHLKGNTTDAAVEKHVPVIEKIDGGVKVGNIRDIAAAGADTFVAGSAIFGSEDYAATIAAMREEIAAAG